LELDRAAIDEVDMEKEFDYGEKHQKQRSYVNPYCC
jgi:hypothetical protein